MKDMKRSRIAALLLALVLCLGLLPTAALAEEEHTESFTITFDANGGVFSDMSKLWTTKTKWLGAGNNITETPPTPEWVGDDYVFDGWDVASDNSIGNVDFTADTLVRAKWRPNSNVPVLKLDPNGGTCSVESVKLSTDDHTAPTLEEDLPTPTREGYTFEGWFVGDREVKAGFASGGTETAVAKWAKIRTSKIDPSLKVICDDSSSKIEAGAKTVKVYLSCATSGAALDWRPLERALYSGGKPSDVEAAVKSYISGNFSAVGLKLTDVKYEHDIPVNDSAYPYELYPEGVYPTTGLTLTLEGEAKTGTLNITLAPGIFVQLVDEGETATLTEASADIFNSAKVSVPVGSGSPDGPFTIKFDLNYKNPKESEVPKEQKIAKGQTVDLPDGKKLTPPAANLEFYAWCMKGTDGKLYPWKDGTPVTADMTLYAGWVKKGTVVKEGQAVPDVSAETSKPAETPAAPKFTDVAATSPFAPAISWAVEKGITNGTTPTTFSPGTTCSTGHILTFLWRSQGSPEPTIANPFKDEIPGAFQKAAVWAREKGLVSGDTFGSAAPCTRAASVTYMWKLAGSPEAKAASFKDVPATSDYAKAISWAVEQGVTKGTGDGSTFSPEATCTRGQIVTFLYRHIVK